jgi:UDP:flavonoid glycosyltransferase YjiC (YdhE family)
MKVLIPVFSPSTGTWGSLTRVLAVAGALGRRGHEVAFCASGPITARLEAAGYKVYTMPQATMFGLPETISRRLAARSQDFSLPVRQGRSVGSVWFVLKLSGMTGYPYLSRLVEAELAAVRDFGPDLLFTEMDPGAFVVSKLTGIRLFATYASVMTRGIGSKAWRQLDRSMARILAEHGSNRSIPPGLYPDPDVVKIIPSIPELEEAGLGGDGYHFVGSLLKSFRSEADPDFEFEEGKRYVFVYVGTGSVSMKRVMKVLPEVFPAGSDTVCLVGSQSARGETRLGNVIIRPFFDADAAIPRCDWVICHGGHNTLIQSLLAGKPLLIFPGPIFERRFNARMVAEAGAGLFAELGDFSPVWLTAALRERPRYAARAAALGSHIASLGGPADVVALMERCAKAPPSADSLQ